MIRQCLRDLNVGYNYNNIQFSLVDINESVSCEDMFIYLEVCIKVILK